MNRINCDLKPFIIKRVIIATFKNSFEVLLFGEFALIGFIINLN